MLGDKTLTEQFPLCYQCKKHPADTYRPTDGRFLCRSCFSDWVIETVRRTIRKGKLFKRDDRIIVGLSGGKDSVVLLDILYHLERDFPSELIAVCIDEGIAGYRDDGLPIARMNAKRLGIEFHLYSFKDLFGYTLDEIVACSRELQAALPSTRQTKIIQHAPCSYCGVFRRKALNFAARELEGDKVATGHNLNDISQTILLNLLRGDAVRLLQNNLSPPIKVHELFVPRVKPLQLVAERNVVLYAFYNNLTYHTTECPYAIEAMRLDVRDFLTTLEEKYPGTLSAIRNTIESLSPSPQKKKQRQPPLRHRDEEESAPITLCQICSEPSRNTICKGCQMLEVLFKKNYSLEE